MFICNFFARSTSLIFLVPGGKQTRDGRKLDASKALFFLWTSSLEQICCFRIKSGKDSREIQKYIGFDEDFPLLVVDLRVLSRATVLFHRFVYIFPFWDGSKIGTGRKQIGSAYRILRISD